MDAEGLGRKLLLTTPGNPRKTPEKQTVGTVTATHKMPTLQALSSSLNAGAAKRGRLGEENWLLGDLRQSVPQDGCVHLHIIHFHAGEYFEGGEAILAFDHKQRISSEITMRCRTVTCLIQKLFNRYL